MSRGAAAGKKRSARCEQQPRDISSLLRHFGMATPPGIDMKFKSILAVLRSNTCIFEYYAASN
jgi:hypothetical protein